MDLKENTKLILLGKTGVGKSALANRLLDCNDFKTGLSSRSTTSEVKSKHAFIGGNKLEVYDTPGFCCTEKNEDDIKHTLHTLIKDCNSSNTVFLLVLCPHRFTEEDRKIVTVIESILKDDLQKTAIAFTHSDELEQNGISIETIIEQSPHLTSLVGKLGKRYHLFNTKAKCNEQVKSLLAKITKWKKNICSKLPGKAECLGSVKTTTERRIVLLGKTGVGKSATGNTILGRRTFKTEGSCVSVTKKCKVGTAVFQDKNVHVTDTPGFFDTELSIEDLAVEIGRTFSLSQPGPHAFVIVVQLNARFTKQDNDVMEMIKAIYGEHVLKHAIVVFTYGDKFKKQNIPIFLERNRFLSSLLDKCDQRYIVFNNRNKESNHQVKNLMNMIDHMLKQNGTTHYTNEMFEKAEKCQKEELNNFRKMMPQLFEKLTEAQDEELQSIIQQIKARVDSENLKSEKEARTKLAAESDRLPETKEKPTTVNKYLGNQAQEGEAGCQEDPEYQGDTEDSPPQEAESWLRKIVTGFWTFFNYCWRKLCECATKLAEISRSCMG